MLYLFSKQREREQREQREREQREKEQNIFNEQREKITDEEIFISNLELKYNIFGKLITLDKNISYTLAVLSNKPRLYSTNKKKHISLFHYELTNYYQLYLIIRKEFEFIKNEPYFRKKFIYLKNKNTFVFNYIQDKYHLFSTDYKEEMKSVPELLDLKNKVIRLVYEVMVMLREG